MNQTNMQQKFIQELEQIAFDILYEYQKEQLTIKLNSNSTTIFQSKFGGTPYLAHSDEIPTNDLGQQFRLLAQINLSELPTNHIFKTNAGILQFWILNDECFGVNNRNGYKIIFYQDIDTSVTKEEVLAKYKPYSENGEDYFPIDGEFALQFNSSIGYCTFTDETFSRIFSQKITEFYHTKKDEYMDIFAKYLTSDNELKSFDIESLLLENSKTIKDKLDQWGHKIGGYPNYTQSDIREDENQDYDILLLQIDSDIYGKQEIMWGDCGVANFFIKTKDLENLNFNDVLYSWDCC